MVLVKVRVIVKVNVGVQVGGTGVTVGVFVGVLVGVFVGVFPEQGGTPVLASAAQELLVTSLTSAPLYNITKWGSSW